MIVISLMTDWIFTRGVKKQMEAFLESFREIIPLEWIVTFDERELEV